jgi:hypothetical protein
VKRALADTQRELLGFMAGNVRVAQQIGDLPAELEPEEVAFELDAILVGADVNWTVPSWPFDGCSALLTRRLPVSAAETPKACFKSALPEHDGSSRRRR